MAVGRRDPLRAGRAADDRGDSHVVFTGPFAVVTKHGDSAVRGCEIVDRTQLWLVVRLMRDLNDQVARSWTDVERTRERSIRTGALGTGKFENLRVADGVRQHDIVAVQIESLPMADRVVHRPVPSFIQPDKARVIEVAAGVGPTRGVGIGEDDVTEDLGPAAVPAVERDVVPVLELRARPAGGVAERVGFEQKKLVAARYAALARIDANSDALAGDVATGNFQ